MALNQTSSSVKQAKIKKENVQVDVQLEHAVADVAEQAVTEVVSKQTEELAAGEEKVEEIVEAPVEVVAKEEAIAVIQEQVKTEAVIQVTTPTPVVAPAAAIALPPVKLHKISIKDLKKKDALLVKAHAHDEDAVKSVKWDVARNVAVIEKNGKFRVYKIGLGSHPSIFENKKESRVVSFLGSM